MKYILYRVSGASNSLTPIAEGSHGEIKVKLDYINSSISNEEKSKEQIKGFSIYDDKGRFITSTVNGGGLGAVKDYRKDFKINGKDIPRIRIPKVKKGSEVPTVPAAA